MKSIYHTLSIFPSNRCNARCEICALSCGPEATEHLSQESGEAVIREAAGMENMKNLFISGGEPLLLREETLHYAQLGSSLGLRVSIFTNGFWGKTEDMARQYARQMKEAGVSAVSFSADRYHQKYIPAASLVRAMEAVLAETLSCELSVMEFADRQSLPWARENLGEKMLQPPVHFLHHPASWAGRAKEHLSEEDFWRPFASTHAPCFHMGIIHIAPDGSWYPCCGMGSRNIPQLRIGNIKELPLAEVEDRIMSNPFLEIILLEGFGWFCRKAREHGLPFPEKVTLPCECCEYLFAHPSLREELEAEVRQHAVELSFASLMCR